MDPWFLDKLADLMANREVSQTNSPEKSRQRGLIRH
ncbi:MAG UNVERIFIED_CONTAM: hypothetical protein LVR29_32095 [Microcystis novacekii LVE1205-3]